MILFLSEGGVGNQLFQYAFIMSIKKDKEKVIIYGFDELIEVFDVNTFFNIRKKNKILKKITNTVIKPMFNLLADLKIISSVAVDREIVKGKYTRESTTYTKRKGFFNFITFVKLGFFQSEIFFNPKIIDTLKIKNKYLKQADDFLSDIPFSSYKVFVHIRLRDYKDFTVYGKSAILPYSYYHYWINWFLKVKENCFFIILTDEPNIVKKEFDYIFNKKISEVNNFGTDFAIMTKCNAAIISASSFSWWGSYFMENRDLVIAPKYWLGFNAKENYHSEPLASFMLGVEVYDTESESLK